MRRAAGREKFSYEVGILDRPNPPGMVSDTLEVEIGSGSRDWERAKEGIRRWAHFDLGWASAVAGGRPPEPGLDVVIHATLLGVHFTPVCRVIGTHDEEASTGARFGFTYGSLESHVETGEELFEVTRKSDGRISYRIDVVARPGRWYTRIAGPLVDRYRARFRFDSAEAMRRYVAG